MDTQEFAKIFVTESVDDAGFNWRGPVISADTLEVAEVILAQMKKRLLVPPSTVIMGEFVADGNFLSDA